MAGEYEDQIIEEARIKEEPKDDIDTALPKKQEPLVPENIFKQPIEAATKEKKDDDDRSAAIVAELLDKGILASVLNNKDIQDNILSQADDALKKNLNILNKKLAKKNQDAEFDFAKEACENFGVPDSVPVWQIRMMKIGSNIWFLVYYFTVGFFIVAPISVFSRSLKTFLKKNWLTIAISIVVYVALATGIVYTIINYIK